MGSPWAPVVAMTILVRWIFHRENMAAPGFVGVELWTYPVVWALMGAFGAAWAFVEPELLLMEPAARERLVTGGPGLAPYTFYLRDVVRRTRTFVARR